MRNTFLFLFLILIPFKIFAQKPEKIHLSNPEDYYLKIVPKNRPEAILFLLHGGGEKPEDVLKKIQLPELALKNNFIVIVPYFSEDTSKMIEEVRGIDEIAGLLIAKYNISKNKIILGGFSGGGMLAVTFAERAVRDQNTAFIPRAIFAVDPPLDLEHVYERSEREVLRNFSELGVSEAKYFIKDLTETFGGSPKFPMNMKNIQCIRIEKQMVETQDS